HQRVHERHRGRTRLAQPGHLGHAPVAYALASDTLISVVRVRRQYHADEAATPLAILGGLLLWLLRLALAPASTLAGFRAWVLAECPSAPGRRPAPAPHPRKATKTARFLDLVTERHGPLAQLPLHRVAAISADLAPHADLNPGSARAALRKAVIAARAGDPDDPQARHRPGHRAHRHRLRGMGVPARPPPARQPSPPPAHPVAPA